MKVELMKHINKNFAIGGRILFFKKQVVNNYYYKYYNPISNTTHNAALKSTFMFRQPYALNQAPRNQRIGLN